jgi:formate-dependent nitrite reductase membrane component NrfD
MVACPYDQLFIDPNTHTAEKCNFCANRVENNLLPACVSVCPTECRIFGDMEDTTSEVYRIVHSAGVSTRKPEKGTLPHVYYVGAEQSAIQPEIAVRPFHFKEGSVTLRPLGSPEPDPLDPGAPRVDYDMPHVKPWGFDMAVYLLTKGIATGSLLLAVILWMFGIRDSLTTIAAPAIALVMVTITAVVLVIDLEQPARFLYILTRPNWDSWLARGAFILTGFGAVTTAWLAAGWIGAESALRILAVPAIALALLATIYTGFLFAQGLARDLWQGPYGTIDLLAQAVAEGAAAMLLATFLPGVNTTPAAVTALGWTLFAAVGVHLAVILIENILTRSPTRHHQLAVRAIRRGAFARIFWGGAVLGGVASLMMIGVAPIAALLALVATFAWEYVWVEAGQSVPLS